MKIVNNQYTDNQLDMAAPSFEVGLLYLFCSQQKLCAYKIFVCKIAHYFINSNIKKCWSNIILIIGLCCSSFLFSTNLISQDCNYLLGDVILNASPEVNPSFYNTAYFIINANTDSILQVNTESAFFDLMRGCYEAYGITYKIRDSIFNLEVGKVISEINSDCLNFSLPYAFTVCSPPELTDLELTDLELCADGNKLVLTDSILFKDNDELLDTFSISVSIIESPDLANDFLDVDITAFIGLIQNYTPPTLKISNIKSPLQTQAILRAVHFYSNSTFDGTRTIEFYVSDGLSISDTLNRKVIITPLPGQPIQIFRKKGKD